MSTGGSVYIGNVYVFIASAQYHVVITKTVFAIKTDFLVTIRSYHTNGMPLCDK